MDYELLHELSLIDRELIAIEKSAHKDERIGKLKVIRGEYNTLRQEYAAIEQDLKDIQKRIDKLTSKIEDEQKDLDTQENLLYNTSSAKSVSAVQTVMERIKTSIESEENVIYDIMQKSEEIKRHKQELIKDAGELKAEYNSLKDEYYTQEKKVFDKKDALESKRKEIVKSITPNVYADYEIIRQEHGYGMSDINKEICTGCGIGIPYIIIDNVRKQKGLQKCPRCGRFLYCVEK